MSGSNPWRVLVRHFWRRFFDTESLSPQSDAEANVKQVLGLLAAPSAFFVIICQPLDLLIWDQVSVRYYCVSFSMIVMSAIVAIQWEALLPDRRDCVILNVLPLSSMQVFSAKAAALGMFLGVFLLDINFFSALMWPGIDGGTDLLAIMAAHIIVVVSAGLFAAVATVVLFGLLMSVLSVNAFRRVAIAAQTLLISVLAMLFFLTPLLAGRIEVLCKTNNRFVLFFPPYWFIGLYERVRPATGNDELLRAGTIGVQALVCVIVLLILTFAFGFRRHARRMLESVDAGGASRRRISAAVTQLLVRNAAQRAVFSFMSHTITRSVKHRLFLATYGGCGVALALMNVASGKEGLMRMPLTLAFILISALRAAFNFPSELRANWVFQVNGGRGASQYLAGMRKWIFACGVVPLFVLLAPMEVAYFGVARAAFHVAFGVIVSMLLMDVMFLGFRKVPFTCSYFPGKVNLAGLSVIYLVGLTVFSNLMATFERWLEHSVMATVAFILVSIAVHVRFIWYHKRLSSQENPVDFEDEVDPAVRTLDLVVD